MLSVARYCGTAGRIDQAMTNRGSETQRPKLRYDVAVIGGGIAGCASAYYLSKKGLSVILLEKGEIAGEQSGRNLGFVRQQGRDPLEIPLMIASKRLWQGLEAELAADLEWRQGGVLYAASSDPGIADYEVWLERAHGYQLDSRLVSGREMAAMFPGMSQEWRGGLYTPSDGQADPVKTTEAFAAAATRLGADLLSGCIVEAIETTGGAIAGLRTEAGEIKASTVLIAAGAWSSRLLRLLGIDLPQLRVRSTVVRTTPVAENSALCFWGPQFGFRQRADGSFIIGAGVRCDHEIGLDSLRYAGAFWKTLGMQKGKADLRLGLQLMKDVGALFDPVGALQSQMLSRRVLAPQPDNKKAQACFAAFRSLFPGYTDIGVSTSWAGMIDVTPDEVAVYGEVPGIPGLVVATGFSGHGFGMGPITGFIMAELIANGRTSIDIVNLRMQRFSKPHASGSHQ